MSSNAPAKVDSLRAGVGGRAVPPKVALLIETSNAYARGLLLGIESYVRVNRAWSIYLVEHGRGDRPPAWLSQWKGDGIIARIENRMIARALEPLKIPIVDVSASCLIPGVPFVETDDAAIALLAVAHFTERGFKTFAFCGDHRFEWAKQREEQFARIIRSREQACYIHRPAAGVLAEDDAFIEDLARWIGKLPKPLAVLACYDFPRHATGARCLPALRGGGAGGGSGARCRQ